MASNKIIINKVAAGETIKGSQWNKLVDAVRRLYPNNSPTVKWETSPNGIAANVVGNLGGGTAVQTSNYSFYINDNDKKEGDTSTDKLWLSYVAGDVYAVNFPHHHKPNTGEAGTIYNTDTSKGYVTIPNDTTTTDWCIIIKYDLSTEDMEGTWGIVECVEYDKLDDDDYKEYDTNGNHLRVVVRIADVYVGNSAGTRYIANVIQKWTQGDIYIYDWYRCGNGY